MLTIIKDRSNFFILTFFYFIIGFFLLEFIPKGNIEIFINHHHTTALDFFFQNITHLGDGIFGVLVILFLFLRKNYWGILMGLSYLISSFVSQGLKRLVFAETLRPSKFFDPSIDLYYIKGLVIHSYFSFPSGHTSGAFTTFCCLALIYKNKSLDILFFIIAFLVGLSRMYLLQHFFMDTYFGTLIGIASALLIFYILENNTNLKHKPSLDKPLFLKR